MARSRAGTSDLDRFFHHHAGQHQFKRRASVTYVAIDGIRIVGFVTVCPGTLVRGDLGPAFRNFPPFPLPTLLIARLAVSVNDQGRGIGAAMLRHALQLARRMALCVGCVGVIVDAKSQAVEWYKKYGFALLTGAGAGPFQRYFLPVTSVPDAPPT